MQKIKLGMVGGGKDAFIGSVHRMAARLDDRYDLVAGALSSSPIKASESAAEIGIDKKRSYTSYQEMAKKEGKLADGIDAVAIVTPNHLHADVAKDLWQLLHCCSRLCKPQIIERRSSTNKLPCPPKESSSGPNSGSA